jgi:hypothetical protein
MFDPIKCGFHHTGCCSYLHHDDPAYFSFTLLRLSRIGQVERSAAGLMKPPCLYIGL